MKILFHKFYRNKFDRELRRIQREVVVEIKKREREEEHNMELARLLAGSKGKV